MESSTDVGLVLTLLSVLLAPLIAQAQQEMPLYAGEIPNSIAAPDEEATRDPNEPHLFRSNVSRPTVTVYEPQPRDTKRAAVIILPGGTYRGVSIVKEGHDVARAFNELGVTAFVLKYRTPSERHMRDKTRGPLQDGQQAIRVVRDRADEWHIERNRIGVVGFSAGGQQHALRRGAARAARRRGIDCVPVRWPRLRVEQRDDARPLDRALRAVARKSGVDFRAT
jgi:acetyl esterase/lipase